MFLYQVWDLNVSPNGKFAVSCGHDKTLRLWEKTQEPLVLEDERETEREAEDEAEASNTDSRAVPGGGKDAEAAMPTKRTAETERAAERLMEALQVRTREDMPCILVIVPQMATLKCKCM